MENLTQHNTYALKTDLSNQLQRPWKDQLQALVVRHFNDGFMGDSSSSFNCAPRVSSMVGWVTLPPKMSTLVTAKLIHSFGIYEESVVFSKCSLLFFIPHSFLPSLPLSLPSSLLLFLLLSLPPSYLFSFMSFLFPSFLLPSFPPFSSILFFLPPTRSSLENLNSIVLLLCRPSARITDIFHYPWLPKVSNEVQHQGWGCSSAVDCMHTSMCETLASVSSTVRKNKTD